MQVRSKAVARIIRLPNTLSSLHLLTDLYVRFGEMRVHGVIDLALKLVLDADLHAIGVTLGMLCLVDHTIGACVDIRSVWRVKIEALMPRQLEGPVHIGIFRETLVYHMRIDWPNQAELRLQRKRFGDKIGCYQYWDSLLTLIRHNEEAPQQLSGRLMELSRYARPGWLDGDVHLFARVIGVINLDRQAVGA